ncbi:MAG TPA: cation-translocating P-type ATPase [Candidatus Binatia bacterium]|nr:cation-translocating P-type ATPase [Candidatus Binatia bacterium]
MNAVDRGDLIRVAGVAVAAALVWFHVWEPFPQISLIGVLATLIGGYPIFKEAIENLLERRMTMELSMTIALVAALLIGQYVTALVITLFVLIAEILEHLTLSRGRRAIGDLLDLLPRETFSPGDVVLVRPGALVPVDGVVVTGHSFVDEARITGESLPAEKLPGSKVFAGTVNQIGAFEVRTERAGRDTAFGRIIDMVESAEQARAPIERLADRFSGYLVYFALGAAAITYAVTRDVRSTISVVIVAGACGIAAGTPLAVLGAIGRAAREGAIVKGGRYLEVLSAIDTVVLDKTGTLTFGEAEVLDVHPAFGTQDEELIAVASSAERPSEHPLGAAIVRRAQALGVATIEPSSFSYTPGRGIVAALGEREAIVGNRAFLSERGIFAETNGTCSGASAIEVALGGRYLGAICVADTLRPEARNAVRALHEMGLRVILLTGDNATVARVIGDQLGIDEVEADLLPEGKVARVEALVRAGRSVAMVGDGVNDAPALARASVGIAMGSGTEVARESADVVLIGNDLEKLVETLRIARRARRIVLQNFVGTIVVDAIGMIFAGLGLLGPLAAAFVHVTSELAFILNSTRMLPAPRRQNGQ